MQFPKLSPLQSRFVASIAASIILLFLLLTLTRPQFAYALDVDTESQKTWGRGVISDHDFLDEGVEDDVSKQEEIELRRRADALILTLDNNAPQNRDIRIGESQFWVLTTRVISGPHGETGIGLPTDVRRKTKYESHHELKKRQNENSTQVYITLNTCMQPQYNSSTSTLTTPPQLQMYYTQSTTLQRPGPGTGAQSVMVDGGYALINITASQDVYIGISAPNTTDFVNAWNYEVAASIDAPFHEYEADTPYLHFVDGDNHAALLITDALTTAPVESEVYKEWMKIKPYGMFAHDHQDRSILGVRNSYCGLLHNARIIANLNNVQNQNTAAMTTRALGQSSRQVQTNFPKEQFYITTLNASSTYWGFLAMEGNSTASGLNVVGGGGKVWAAMNFTTKAASNCALMYNLTFCSDVAYAVPTNPDLFSPRTGLPQLAAIYDNYAAQMYQYFNYSLQQIPCNTTSSAQYSLARNCDDCARAYKQWLCAVTIPRCEDYSNTATWLYPRNVAQAFANGSSIANPQSPANQILLNEPATNSSRNAIIDQEIKPGPYKEVLPCDDVCYNLVQSCPAALGFGCPTPNSLAFGSSYAVQLADTDDITCSYLGAAYGLNGATKLTSILMTMTGKFGILGWSIGLGIMLAM